MNFNKIYLIGYMGSGKTTIGKRLAQALGLLFLDLDTFIENRYHKSIQQIFSEKGEAFFRKLERNALLEISEFENVVISTGGGLPCFYDNLEIMNKTGLTIYLKVPIEQLTKRLEKGKQNRPLLKGKDSKELYEFISCSLEKREGFYNQASFIFDAKKLFSHTDVDVIVSNLITYLSGNENNSSGEGKHFSFTSGFNEGGE